MPTKEQIIAVLEPFADYLTFFEHTYQTPVKEDDEEIWLDDGTYCFKLREFRAARTLLHALKEGEDNALTCLRDIVQADNDAPDFGLCDCRDNDGEHYQSADLAATLIQARQLIASLPSDSRGEG